MSKHDKGAQAQLDPDETVLAQVKGAYESPKGWTRNGVLYATDRRLLFYSNKVIGYDMESFPYSRLSSFESGKRMTGEWIRFFASGNTVEVKWVKGDVAAFTRAVRSKTELADMGDE